MRAKKPPFAPICNVERPRHGPGMILTGRWVVTQAAKALMNRAHKKKAEAGIWIRYWCAVAQNLKA